MAPKKIRYLYYFGGQQLLEEKIAWGKTGGVLSKKEGRQLLVKKCHNDVKECPNEERQVWLLPEGQAGAQNCLGAGRCNFARRTSRCRKMPEERQV